MLMQNRIWFALSDTSALNGVLLNDELQMSRIIPVPMELEDRLNKAQDIVKTLEANKDSLIASKGEAKYSAGYTEALSQVSEAKSVISAWKESNWGTTESSIPVVYNTLYLSWQSTGMPSAEFLVRLSKKIHSDFDYYCAGECIGYDTASFAVDSSQAFRVEIENPFEFACMIWLVDYCDYIVKSKGFKGKIKYSEIAPCVSCDDSDIILDNLLGLKEVMTS